MIIAGSDEAGRGPVIGPLVMVALAVKEEDQKKLEWLGVKDSKLLTKQVREELFERIREIVHDFRVEIIEPDAIDLSLNEAESNLNWLEAETTARMMSELDPDKMILDCPSINIESYKNYFMERLSKAVKDKAELIVEHKADMNYVVVAAASVIAKVIRDRHIENIIQEIGIDLGSGYPSDPKTQQFLKEHHETHANLFRRSWKSYQRAQIAKQQKTLQNYGSN